MQREGERVGDDDASDVYASGDGAVSASQQQQPLCDAGDDAVARRRTFVTVDEMAQRAQEYNDAFDKLQHRLTDLWGPADAYAPSAEDAASLLSQLYYIWVQRTVKLAAGEKLTYDVLPPPTADVRAHSCGLRLSRAVQRAAYVRHAWDAFVGAEVASVDDAQSRGFLRWVGIPQQGGYTRVMAAVEWTSAPASRLAQHNAAMSAPHMTTTTTSSRQAAGGDGSRSSQHQRSNTTTSPSQPSLRSPFFDGVVHGEHLFTPCRSNASTLEDPRTLTFVLAPRTSALGQALPTPRRLGLTRQLVTALPSYLWWQFPYKLTGDVCTLTLPLLLGAVVNYLQAVEAASWSYGLLLVVSLFVVQAVQSLALQRFYYVSIKGGLQYRSALTAALFEKCFTMSSKAMMHPEMNVGRIINMVSTDTERANNFMQFAMYLWSSPTVFIVAIVQLYNLVGWCAIMAVVAMLVWMPINSIVMRRLLATRRELVKATDTRVKATNEFLSGIRIAKFMTWEPSFIASIDKKRTAEMVHLRRMQTYRVATSFINTATPLLMIACVFVLFSIVGNGLTPSIIFPAIALLNIMRMPFMMIPFVLTSTVQFYVSITRIRNFLECEDEMVTNTDDIVAYYRHGKRAEANAQHAHTRSSDEDKNTTNGYKQQHDDDNNATDERASAIFAHADLTAYAAVQLPTAKPVRMSLVKKMLRQLCCIQAYKPRRTFTIKDAPASHSASDTPAAQSGDTIIGKQKRTKSKAKKGKKPKGKPNTQTFHELVPRTLLRDVTLSIPRGKLTLVVGATGAGKSVLLQAILGQFEVTRGHIWATRNIAYVPQQAWIMNATLRDNILFFKDEQPDALREALRVSQLDMDLKLLTSGLETEIGEKGINLSGGQRARVSLARAVYADREMYVLDDPLSALDAHVGERVMAECVLGKLAGKTRVLATHHLHVLGRADYVIAVGDGRVLYAGDCATFTQTAAYRTISAATEDGAGNSGEAATAVVVANGGAAATATADVGSDATTTTTTTTSISSGVSNEDGSHSGRADAGQTTTAAAASAHTADTTSNNNDNKTATASNSNAAAAVAPRSRPQSSAKADAVADAGARLIVEEEKASGSVPWSTYFTYFDYCGGPRVMAVIAAVFIGTELMTVTSTLWLTFWSTGQLKLSETMSVVGYVALVMLTTVSAPLRFTTSFTAMRRGSRRMHRALLAAVATGTMNFFDTTPLGRIVNRFSRDIDVLDDGLQYSLNMMFNCIMSIISSSAVIVVSQPVVLCVLVPCAIVYYRLMIFYNSANREVRRLSSITKSPLFSLLGEVISGASTINAYGSSNAVMREALRRIDRTYSCGNLENAANRWLGARIELLSNVNVTAIALSGVVSIMLRLSWVNLSLISLALTMALQTTSQLNWLVRQAAATEADMNSVERTLHYIHHIEREDMPEMNEEVEVLLRKLGADTATASSSSSADAAKSGTNATAVVIEADAATAATTAVVAQDDGATDVAAGSLEFAHVNMRYRAGLPLVLRDVSFVIRPGEKVGVVGRTGSGKSTLLLTFLRMVDVCGGEIVVSGRPIQAYSLRALRRLFSMIPQDPVLFDGTVRLNVDPFLQATTAEVWHALDVVGLRLRIESESEGIDSRVQEGGSNFSVGQRQLLCMARALLKRGSQFILMDEATANVDPNLDAYIQRTVMRAFARYTVITIAHRLHTVASYDKIIVMDRGAVAEMGTTRELATRPGSLFRGMVEALGKSEHRRFLAAIEDATRAPANGTNGHAVAAATRLSV